MDSKIEIIEDNGKGWHWIILDYLEEDNQWFNVSSGYEKTYEKAAIRAKEEYDINKKIK